jgi:hypothetical protein
MTVKINERLNLVTPIYDDVDGDPTGYVHSTPMSRMAFESHYRLLGAVFASLQQQGIVDFAGPTVAALELRKIAADRKDEAGAQALLNEIRRLSVFIFPGTNGWEYMPVYQAVSANLMSEEDASLVENGLVFFTAASFILPRTIAGTMTAHVMKRWGASMSSLAPTEFIASLPTSTATDSSGATGQSDTAEAVRMAKAAAAMAVPANSPPGPAPIQGRITV